MSVFHKCPKCDRLSQGVLAHTLPGMLGCQDPECPVLTPKTITYDTAKVSYKGMYLSGEFTKEDMMAISHDAVALSKIFWEMDKAVLLSMREKK